MLEANACGLPVAAYPVTGPIDVVQQGVTGSLHEDLRRACLDALQLDPRACRDYALANSWERCADMVIQAAKGTIYHRAMTAEPDSSAVHPATASQRS